MVSGLQSDSGGEESSSDFLRSISGTNAQARINGLSPLARAREWSRLKTSSSGTPRGETDSTVLQTEVENLKERRKKTGDGKYILDVHESMQKLQRKLYKLQSTIVLIVLLTLILGVWVNEICGAQDYQPDEPSPEEVLRIKEQHGRPCDSDLAEGIKIVLSCLTAVLIFLVVKQWLLLVQLQERDKRIEEYYFMPGGTQLKRKTPLTKYIALVFEVAICAIHPFPYVYSDIEVYFILKDTPMFYRFESATAGFMFLRIYLVWRWFKLVAFFQFLNLEDSFAMEDYSALDQMHLSTNISANTFPLKVMVSKYPVSVIASSTFLTFFSMSYLIRITEGPAYQPHSDDWWDQMWITITQGTTGYGGTTPVTQWGRFCSVLMMLCGPMAVSFMTATTSKSITLTSDELALLQHMEANTRKIRVLTTAAELLQDWWRERLNAIPRLQERMEKRNFFRQHSMSNLFSPLSAARPTEFSPLSTTGGGPLHSPNGNGESGPDRRGEEARAHAGKRASSVKSGASGDEDQGWRFNRGDSDKNLKNSSARRSSQESSSSTGEVISLHEYTAQIGHVAKHHRRRSHLRRTESTYSISRTGSEASSAARSTTSHSTVDMPMAASNPIVLRFVYLLGQPYRNAKSILLVRNFYTALASYDRFMMQHRRVTDISDHHANAENLHFHAANERSGMPPAGFEELRQDVEMLQIQMGDVLEGIESVKRMERMLAHLLPPDVAEKMKAEQVGASSHARNGRALYSPGPKHVQPRPGNAHAEIQDDGAAGVGKMHARQKTAEDGRGVGGEGKEAGLSGRKTVSFREQDMGTAERRRHQQKEIAQRQRRHSMEAVPLVGSEHTSFTGPASPGSPLPSQVAQNNAAHAQPNPSLVEIGLIQVDAHHGLLDYRSAEPAAPPTQAPTAAIADAQLGYLQPGWDVSTRNAVGLAGGAGVDGLNGHASGLVPASTLSGQLPRDSDIGSA